MWRQARWNPCISFAKTFFFIPVFRRVRGWVEPQTISDVDPFLMVNIVGFSGALATIARFPEKIIIKKNFSFLNYNE